MFFLLVTSFLQLGVLISVDLQFSQETFSRNTLQDVACNQSNEDDDDYDDDFL